MHFDLFHSFGLVDHFATKRRESEVFEAGLSQASLAEKLGFGTLWVAESHFSSEVQKQNQHPVIPSYRGEVGLNADSFQLFWCLAQRTTRLGFGTAILNIVGGNGGPIAAADRVQTLTFLNQTLRTPRELAIGFAAGRFPYINTPFGVRPRNAYEEQNWKELKSIVFMEALEIFLRLQQNKPWSTRESQLLDFTQNAELEYHRFWDFEPLELVPRLDAQAESRRRFVLGSSDPRARDLAFSIRDVDLFNLSFTAPALLEALHEKMLKEVCAAPTRASWQRSRLPRTVMVFIDSEAAKARAKAEMALDTYIEAMRGTAMVPDKEVLLSRALVGDPQAIRDQLAPDNERGFHPDDRLMLWFEFNQNHHQDICSQMKLFADEVMPHFC